MKSLRKLLVTIIFSLLIVALTACDFSLDEFLNDDNTPDYNFSEGGIDEIKFFFRAVNSGKFTGKIEWKVKREVYDNGTVTGTDEYTVKVYSYGQDEDRKLRVDYIDAEKDLTIITVDQESHYIDNDDKTVSTTISGDFIGASSEISWTLTHGVIKLQDDGGEILWNFVSRSYATIKDAGGTDRKAIEFLYESAEEDDGITKKLRVDFLRTFPTILMLNYEIYQGDMLLTKAYIHIPVMGGEVSEEVFNIPGEDEGYTEIIPT